MSSNYWLKIDMPFRLELLGKVHVARTLQREMIWGWRAVACQTMLLPTQKRRVVSCLPKEAIAKYSTLVSLQVFEKESPLCLLSPSSASLSHHTSVSIASLPSLSIMDFACTMHPLKHLHAVLLMQLSQGQQIRCPSLQLQASPTTRPAYHGKTAVQLHTWQGSLADLLLSSIYILVGTELSPLYAYVSSYLSALCLPSDRH